MATKTNNTTTAGSGGAAAAPALLADIKGRVVSALSWSETRRSNLFIETRVLRKGSALNAYKQKIPVTRDSILVFADDRPQANWAHPCRYLLHDARNGEVYREVPARFPPYMNELPKSFEGFHLPHRLPEYEVLWPVLPQLRCPIRWVRGTRYAILFSGASNNRHTNDLEFLYRTLRDQYGFPAANIRVLNYNGSVDYSGNPHPVGNWPGNGTAYRMPVHAAGTKAALESALDWAKARLKPEDLLLIHTNNHGGHNGTQSYLCTYSGADYLASDFAAKLATLPKFEHLMVMMEQCHSAGFNTPVINSSPATHTSISSACEELESSIGGPQFDPFARDWISAVAGHTPSGGALASNPDSNNSGFVAAKEAHDYATAVKDPFDTPVFNSTSAAARNMHLGQRFSVSWPAYCRWLVEGLQPWYVRLPLPDFYDIVHRKLLPGLAEVEARLQADSVRQQAELGQAVTEAIKKAFGK